MKLFIDENNPFTWVYGLGRSILAFSMLCTIIFNDINMIFESSVLKELEYSDLLYNKINIFVLFGHQNLIWSKCLIIVILIAVISGFYPKITGILNFWVFHSFHNACIYLDGGDQIGTILSALLVPITLLDSRNNHWEAKPCESSYTKFLGRIFFIIIAIQVSFRFILCTFYKKKK